MEQVISWTGDTSSSKPQITCSFPSTRVLQTDRESTVVQVTPPVFGTPKKTSHRAAP